MGRRRKKRYGRQAVDVCSLRRGVPIWASEGTVSTGPGPIRRSYLNSSDTLAPNDARQIKYFLDNVKSGDFDLDIGGHYGQYGILFSAMVGPKGQVVTFEPDSMARDVLIRNLALNEWDSRTRLETVALSDDSRTRDFFSLGGNPMSSLAGQGSVAIGLTQT